VAISNVSGDCSPALRACASVVAANAPRNDVINMTFPTLLFALLVAVFYGVLYHLIRNGGFWRLVLYLVLSIAGFAIGHFIGIWRGWLFIPLGSLNIGMSSIGSLFVLIVGDWLSRIEASPKSKV
jgi:hypothetical protein